MSDLGTEDLDRLRRELRAAIRSAIRKGGVHTGGFIPAWAHGGPAPGVGTLPWSGPDRRPNDVLVPGLPDLSPVGVVSGVTHG